MSNFFYFIFLFCIVWFIICYWNIFKKAGRKGRETLIPIWNVYVLYKIIGYKWFFWIGLIFTIVAIIEIILSFTIFNIDFDYQYRSKIISLYRSFSIYYSYGLAIYIILSSLIVCYGLCNKFGKNMWFFAGLFFLRPFFLPKIAFGSDFYLGIDSQKTISFKRAIIITFLITVVIFGIRTLIGLPSFIRWYYANFDKCPYGLRYRAGTIGPTDVCNGTTFGNVEVGDKCEFFVGMGLVPADGSCDKYIEKLKEGK